MLHHVVNPAMLISMSSCRRGLKAGRLLFLAHGFSTAGHTELAECRRSKTLRALRAAMAFSKAARFPDMRRWEGPGPGTYSLQRLFDEQRAPKPLEQPARPAHRILDCPDFWLE